MLRAPRQCSAASLVWFRCCVGGALLWETLRAFRDDRIRRHFIEPAFHFGYGCVSWFEPPNALWIYAVFGVLAVASMGVIAGAWYRFCSVLQAGLATYVFLFDRTHYLNHGYLIVLFAWLAAALPAHRMCSVDVRWRGQQILEHPPRLCLALVRFHVALPYVFGGVAKLNADWLAGEPLLYWVRQSAHRVPWIGDALQWPEVGWSMVYGGLLFDLLVVPALLYRRTRRWAYGTALAFHTLNAALFDIGVFPWLMVAVTALFFEPAELRDWVARVVRFDVKTWGAGALTAAVGFAFAPSDPLGASLCAFVGGSLGLVPSTAGVSSPTDGRVNPDDEVVGLSGNEVPRHGMSRFAVPLAAVYCALHLFLPLRAFAYPGNPLWTEQGMMFSWRMMLREKLGTLSFRVEHIDEGRTEIVDPSDDLTEEQAMRIVSRPDMMVCYARSLRERGRGRVEVYGRSSVSLHERSAQPLVDPARDLATVSISPWRAWDFIVPLRELYPPRAAPRLKMPEGELTQR